MPNRFVYFMYLVLRYHVRWVLFANPQLSKMNKGRAWEFCASPQTPHLSPNWFDLNQLTLGCDLRFATQIPVQDGR